MAISLWVNGAACAAGGGGGRRLAHPCRLRASCGAAASRLRVGSVAARQAVDQSRLVDLCLAPLGHDGAHHADARLAGGGLHDGVDDVDLPARQRAAQLDEVGVVLRGGVAHRLGHMRPTTEVSALGAAGLRRLGRVRGTSGGGAVGVCGAHRLGGAGAAARQRALLQPEQHRDAVTVAAVTLLAAGEDLVHERAADAVLAGPGGDRYAAAFELGSGLLGGAGVLHARNAVCVSRHLRDCGDERPHVSIAVGEKIGTNVPIGERLREERERLGFALGAFCARVGVDRKSQFNYESGARAPGAAYLAESLGLGVDVIYVLSGVRSSEPAPPPMSASNSPTSANLSRPGDPHLLADEPAPTGGKVATSRPLADEPAPTGG